MNRYLCYPEGTWGSLFGDLSATHEIRFVFDTEENKVVYADTPTTSTSYEFLPAKELDDLTLSLVEVNPEVIEEPIKWGLTPTDDWPEWASSEGKPLFGF